MKNNRSWTGRKKFGFLLLLYVENWPKWQLHIMVCKKHRYWKGRKTPDFLTMFSVWGGALWLLPLKFTQLINNNTEYITIPTPCKTGQTIQVDNSSCILEGKILWKDDFNATRNSLMFFHLSISNKLNGVNLCLTWSLCNQYRWTVLVLVTT